MTTHAGGPLLQGHFPGGLLKDGGSLTTVQGAVGSFAEVRGHSRLLIQGSFTGRAIVEAGSLLVIQGSANFLPTNVEGEVQVSGTALANSWLTVLPTGPAVLVAAGTILLVAGVPYLLLADGTVTPARGTTTVVGTQWLRYDARANSFTPLSSGR